MKRFAMLAMLAMLATGVLLAQDTGEEPEFVRNMVQLMSEAGWANEDIAEFRRACEAYQWEGTEDLDPRMLMRALRYAYEHGGSGDGTNAEQHAQLAFELAIQTRQMLRLGMEARDISVVTAAATRETMRSRDRNMDGTGEGPAAAVPVRTRLQEATRTQLQELLRTRLRENEPQGTATRTGEDSTPGSPPATPGSNPDPGGGGDGGEGSGEPGGPSNPDPGSGNEPDGPNNPDPGSGNEPGGPNGPGA